jgi:hypothetical protein
MYIYIEKQTVCRFKLKMNPGFILIMHTDGKDNTICSWKLTSYIYQFRYKENVLAEPQGSAEHSLILLPYRNMKTKCIFIHDWSEDRQYCRPKMLSKPVQYIQ